MLTRPALRPACLKRLKPLAPFTPSVANGDHARPCPIHPRRRAVRSESLLVERRSWCVWIHLVPDSRMSFFSRPLQLLQRS